MEIDIKQKIAQYSLILAEIEARCGDETKALVILQEIGKDMRANNIQQHKSYNGNYPATENQIGYLKSLGAEIPEGLTKRQASQLIDDLTKSSEQSEEMCGVPIRNP